MKHRGRCDRRLYRLSACVAAIFFATAVMAQRSTTPEDAGRAEARPNILFILADQYRWDCVGAAGNPRIHTPNLDRLARQGTWFNRTYAAQPVCSPNRAAILTGLYPHAAGVPDNYTGGPEAQHSLPSTSLTLSEMLTPAGYDCGYFGKWHLGRRDAFPTFPEYPHDGRGEGHYFGKDDNRRYAVDVITDDAIAFLKRPRNQPFYLYVSYYPPHPPFVAPPGYEDRYRDIADREQRIYYAMCTKVDEAVGELLAALDALGRAHDTLVVFTSDHGHNFAPRWNNHHKRVCYDTSARVPLMIRWPGVVPAGRCCDALVSSVDLTPTLLGLAGQAVPPDLHGRDLSDLVRGRTDAGRPCVFIENVPYPFEPAKGEERCVFDGRFKLILSTRRPPELLDLRNDPEETTNRWEDMRGGQVARRLLDQLADWAVETDDTLAPRFIAAARGSS
ncbi:MAG TPA: sulfatase-like hydrolase/transferase [Phycisphaerae bacterium]|nr:sulfatase-like hydrolase/transferase [Phycisphaerae bacterium]